jgi:hypothetical protein
MLAILVSAVAMHPLVFVHYMPWYQSKPFSGQWGWHWTMNHFNPDRSGPDGRQELASRYRPLIGAYDSADPDVLEYQTLEMKLAGIDGVFIDWYGVKSMYDYAQLNRNAGKMIEACSKVGLKYSIVIEDQVVAGLVKAGKSTPDDYATSAINWLNSDWFKRPGYLRWEGKPTLLMFGPQYYEDADLRRLFAGPALFTLLNPKGPAVGAFGWPGPQPGEKRSWADLHAFYDRARSWPAAISVVYPRFEDIYKEAGVGPGYGEIPDRNGATFRVSLTLAELSNAPFLQVATWNDWGEGTQIEPSVEFGYRDLETLQAERIKSNPGFRYRSDDLKLPAEIYSLRKKGADKSRLDRAVKTLLAGQVAQASHMLTSLERASRR